MPVVSISHHDPVSSNVSCEPTSLKSVLLGVISYIASKVLNFLSSIFHFIAGNAYNSEIKDKVSQDNVNKSAPGNRKLPPIPLEPAIEGLPESSDDIPAAGNQLPVSIRTLVDASKLSNQRPPPVSKQECISGVESIPVESSDELSDDGSERDQSLSRAKILLLELEESEREIQARRAARRPRRILTEGEVTAAIQREQIEAGKYQQNLEQRREADSEKFEQDRARIIRDREARNTRTKQLDAELAAVVANIQSNSVNPG